MPDRFAWARVAHRSRKHRQDDAVARVVVRNQSLIAAHPHIGRNVVPFGSTNKRMDDEPIHRLEGALRQVFVSAMDRVAGLERDNRLPVALSDYLAQFERSAAMALELMRENILENRNLAPDIVGGLRPEVFDTRVCGVGGPVRKFGLLGGVEIEDLFDID